MSPDPGPDDDLARIRHPSSKEIFRDDHLWVLDKPSGVLSHPNPPAARAGNALLRVPYDFEEEAYLVASPGGRPRKIHLIHRLDQETSGLILCAFREETAMRLKEALLEREVVKEYRAVLLGIPEPRRGEWRDRLEKSRQRGRVTVESRRGHPNAITAYAVLKVLEPAGLAMVSLHPETGRTHQLRVQAAARGCPVAGDERYGDFTANRFLESECGLKRMFLHAYHLELRHPVTGHGMKFHAPITTRLSAPLEKMRSLLVPIPRRPLAGGSGKPGARSRGRRGR